MGLAPIRWFSGWHPRMIAAFDPTRCDGGMPEWTIYALGACVLLASAAVVIILIRM
jgi:hypothetical protein